MGAQPDFQIVVDGVGVRSCATAFAAGSFAAANLCTKVAVSAGVHIVKIQWRLGGGTGMDINAASDPERYHAALLVKEVGS